MDRSVGAHGVESVQRALSAGGVRFRLLRSVKMTPEHAAGRRLVATVHRRYFDADGIEGLAHRLGWELPPEVAACCPELIRDGAVSFVHLGFDARGTDVIRKVYLERGADQPEQARVGRWPSGVRLVAFKWLAAERPDVSISHYVPERRLTVDEVLRELEDPALDLGWAQLTRSLLHTHLGAGADEVADALRVDEIGSPRWSFDLRVPVERRALPADSVLRRWLAQWPEAHRAEYRWLTDAAAGPLIERIAIGRANDGQPFASVYAAVTTTSPT